MTALPAAAVLLAVAVLLAPAPTSRLPRPIGTIRTFDRTAPVSGRATSGSSTAAMPLTALAATGAAVAALLSCGPAVAAAVLMVTALVIARRRRQRRRRDRRRDGEALTSALETLVGELAVGAHPVAAVATVAQECGREGATDVGAQFGVVAARARLGSDVLAGLRLAGTTSVVPEYWARVAVCWQLAAEHGLSMTVLMRAAQRDIADRQRFADRVDAGTAGARATATILAFLPGLGVVLGELVGAHPLRFLLGPGEWLLFAGVALICAGVWWADRIIDRATR